MLGIILEILKPTSINLLEVCVSVCECVGESMQLGTFDLERLGCQDVLCERSKHVTCCKVPEAGEISDRPPGNGN